tara:strand:- start:17 stop:856 length:840 start_codon:yes stop_codon:yes gene_type:complete
MAFKMGSWSGYQKKPAFVKDDKFVENNPNAKDPMEGQEYATNVDNTSESKSKNKADWSKNEAGYDVKTTRRKNLFGRDRVVEKYFDPETGEKLGKQVTVSRGEGDPRADKVKIKKVNPGLTQSSGVGKIRLDENPWDKPTGTTDAPTEAGAEGPKAFDSEAINREEFSDDNKDLFGDTTTYGPDGEPIIPKYKASFESMQIGADGRRINPRNNSTYEDSPEGLQEFEDEAEAWWDEQARITGNKKLEEQDQEYGREYPSPNTYKKRGPIVTRNIKRKGM